MMLLREPDGLKSTLGGEGGGGERRGGGCVRSSERASE
jgi:hypothetical protein